MPPAIEPVSGAAAVETVARLARAVWTATYPPLIGIPQTEYMLEKFQSAAAVTAQIAAGLRYFLLHDETGEPAGYFAVAPMEDHLFLSKLYVAAEKQGQGYAKLALAHARGLAGALGLRKIALTVNRGNAAAIAAYRRLGFAVAGTVVADIGGGYVMDDFRMEWVWDE